MPSSASKFQSMTGGTSLADLQVHEIPILGTGEIALAIETTMADSEAAWRAARNLATASGRWPVISTFWSGCNDGFRERVVEEEFFSRFYFEERVGNGPIYPREILDNADSLSAETALASILERQESWWDFDESIEFVLADLEYRYGTAPSLDDVPKQRLANRDDLSRWQLEWELEQPADGMPEHARQPWFEQDPAVLLLLPVKSGWDSLAYLSFFGVDVPEEYIAVGRQWERDFGAELFAHLAPCCSASWIDRRQILG